MATDVFNLASRVSPGASFGGEWLGTRSTEWAIQPSGFSTETQSIGTTPSFDAVAWLPAALSQIESFCRLGSNWDSYSSPPISKTALASARALLAAIRTETAPKPSLAPVSGGGISIDWDLEKRELEVEILPDGSVEFLKVNGTNLNDPRAMREVRVSKAEAVPINLLLEWIMRG